ncbi:MAG: hypothetical protein HC794_06885 [Nitrospiraceae bacterium]|nr:hypothetical protein [Nitrospiraceae bacterium]
MRFAAPAGHTATQPDAIDDAIRRSQSWFLSQQHAEGYWVAELEADTTLTSEYLMLRRFLDRVDVDREQKAVHYLKSMQLLTAAGRFITEGRRRSARRSRRILRSN